MRTFLGYLMVAAGLGALYAVIMFAPLQIDHFSVKDIINSSHNRFRELGTVENLRLDLFRRLNSVNWAKHTEVDDFGAAVEKDGLGLEDEAIETEFDERTKRLRIKVKYDRVVRLKPTDKVRVFHFVYEKDEVPPNL